MPFCPNCGSEVPDGVRFCTNCGANIATASPKRNAPPPASSMSVPKNYQNVIAGLILVAILLVALAYVGGYFGEYQSATSVHIEIASIARSYLISSLLGFAQFTMEVNVWSTGSSNVALQQITISTICRFHCVSL